MQDDGNFVYYEQPQGAPAPPVRAHWSSGKILPTGQFFAIIQDDGNFCVYKGTGPSDSHGFVWESQSKDPVVNFEEISKIEYDVGAGRVLNTGPVQLFRQTVHNTFDTPQTSTIGGNLSWSVTSGWADTLGVKVGVKTNLKCGIPILAEGQIEVSAEVSNTYTWSGSDTNTKGCSFSAPVTVPPHTTMVALVSTTLATIAVPYAITGTFVLKSGTRWSGQVHGIYTGSNAYNVEVTFLKQDPVTMDIVSTTQKIQTTELQPEP
jgi:hypothetical protein